MKRIILITSILFTCFQAFSQWELISNSYGSMENEQLGWLSCHMDVYFLNKDTGFVTGGAPHTWANEGIILRTFDGGVSWDTTYCKSPILSIYFIDNNYGFAGSTCSKFYKTINGGDTWQEIDVSSSIPYGLEFYNVYFLNPMYGFLSSSIDDSNHAPFKTTDGGLTWQMLSESGGDISFPSDSIGYCGLCLKTIDGGNTWFQVLGSSTTPYLGIYGPCTANSFINNNYGMNSGRYFTGYNGRGYIAITHDGGINQMLIQFNGLYNINDVKMITENITYAVGRVAPYCENFSPFIVTMDGGNTWYQQEFEIDTSYQYIYPGLLEVPLLTAICFPTRKIGYAVGPAGKIYKTTNSGGNLIPIPEVATIHEEDIEQEALIYPNPANEILNIKYKDVTIQDFSLKIYNTEGKLVQNGGANIFDNNIRLKISSLPIGIYFVKITGGKNTKTFKFIKN